MSAHTPGPWGVPDIGTEKGYVKVSAGTQFGWKGLIASCDAGNVAQSASVGLANAHLISAAPDLLEALEKLMGSFHFLPCSPSELCPDQWEMAEYAIAKAKGDSL